MSHRYKPWIIVYRVPHENQRYPTAGDWTVNLKNGRIEIAVSETGNPDYSFLLAIHELIEAVLCIRDDVTDEEVTRWDLEHLDLDEPGDHANAPYHKQHTVAFNIERALADEMKVDWSKYSRTIDQLGEVEEAVDGEASR